jgi:hypothetical protein
MSFSVPFLLTFHQCLDAHTQLTYERHEYTNIILWNLHSQNIRISKVHSCGSCEAQLRHSVNRVTTMKNIVFEDAMPRTV